MMMPTTADAGNIRQRNQRPHRGTAHALDHLHIDSEGGLVDTGNHQRRVEEAEQRGADGAKLPVNRWRTAKATPSPIRRPNGPIMACARNTARISEQTGTITVEVVRHNALEARLDKA